MSKIIIPKNLNGKELTKFLIEHKEALIDQKKSLIKKTDDGLSSMSIILPSATDKTKMVKVKALTEDDEPDGNDDNTLEVEVVCNACWWCDSDMDVLLTDSSKKTIAARKGLIPHLHDHVHMLDAQLGDVQDVYLEDVPLKELGLSMSGKTQCIIMKTLLQQDYNPKVFALYKAGKVQQHSIGLRYVQIELAINDEESEKEFDFWNKFYPSIINKDVVDEAGYFFPVREIMLLENSAVLFGSNSLTPTRNNGKSNSKTAAKASALENESAEEIVDGEWDFKTALLTTKFV
jgi:hypothetical protein